MRNRRQLSPPEQSARHEVQCITRRVWDGCNRAIKPAVATGPRCGSDHHSPRFAIAKAASASADAYPGRPSPKVGLHSPRRAGPARRARRGSDRHARAPARARLAWRAHRSPARWRGRSWRRIAPPGNISHCRLGSDSKAVSRRASSSGSAGSVIGRCLCIGSARQAAGRERSSRFGQRLDGRLLVLRFYGSLAKIRLAVTGFHIASIGLVGLRLGSDQARHRRAAGGSAEPAARWCSRSPKSAASAAPSLQTGLCHWSLRDCRARWALSALRFSVVLSRETLCPPRPRQSRAVPRGRT